MPIENNVNSPENSDDDQEEELNKPSQTDGRNEKIEEIQGKQGKVGMMNCGLDIQESE